MQDREVSLHVHITQSRQSSARGQSCCACLPTHATQLPFDFEANVDVISIYL